MGVLNRIMARSATAPSLAISEKAAPLNYMLSSFRWHLDSRPPSKVILLHDFMSSSASWQLLLHQSLGRLPASQVTPQLPLELYAVDLRGHNHSCALPCPTDMDAYILACAADVVLLRQQILRSETRIVGIGFGALVACYAALHSPENGIDSLTLFVSSPSQMFSCDPSKYHLPSIVKDVPNTIKTFAELNQYLRKKIPNEVERALILSLVEQRGDAVAFRLSNDITTFNQPLTGLSGDCKGVVFPKEVTVVHCGTEEFPQVLKDRFMEHFPKAQFICFQGDRSTGLSGLYSQGPAVVRAVLGSMNMLEVIQPE
ncbi:hypothetical protein ERJ75_000713600 [Trypanosoma vivax]|uniref:AB hydrolase-1 domain-containing protein n=1 Tax=Trypanosoma vivax (strain Y486) TaxID=1055687 RepID=G0TTT5_TRYVY|nr:hypothetical protein TRVL_00063 [Trypanosoma vivax]KAH8613627.1 hypothetical protein ERJ75_000713600 [Trypanosoma vivax]CCC47367.1 conserved hypothetical protein [Trypanosoma vivax Y486]